MSNNTAVTQVLSNNAHMVRLYGNNGTLEIYSSYDTVVAAYYRDGLSIKTLRLSTTSRTISKHLNEFGARHWTIATSDEIQALIREAIINIGLSYLPACWGETAKQAA